jgi:hypothetical protein
MSIDDTTRSVVEGPLISRDLCIQVVEAFANGWKSPNPHAWDQLLAADVVLQQPLMSDGVGVDHWQREFARLQDFLPDIRGQVIDWAQVPDGVLIHLRCNATAGGRPLTFDAIDRLAITEMGMVVRRVSFFDPSPLVATLLARPRAWRAWWSSGMAPLTMRRAILPSSHRDPRRVLTLGLGLTRSALGLAIFVNPQLVNRSFGFRSLASPSAKFAARAFAARDFSIGVATLSQDPGVVRIGLRLGVFADTADTISILLGRRHGIAGRAAVTIGATAAALAVAGAFGHHRLPRSARPRVVWSPSAIG